MLHLSRRRFLSSAAITLFSTAVTAACTAPSASSPTAATTSEPKTATSPTQAAPSQPKSSTPSGQTAPASGRRTTVRLAIRQEAGSEAALKDLLEKFHSQHSNIQVTSAELPPYEGFFEKMMTQVAAGTAPDVFMLIAYWGAVFGKTGNILLPLDEYLRTSKAFSKDAFDKTLLTYCEWNGKLHALPLNTNIQGIHYNRDHFEKAGITKVPQTEAEAWSWEQFLGVCEQLKAAKVADYPYGIYPGAPQGRLIFVYQQGHGIVTQDLKRGDLASPEAVDAIELIHELFAKKYAPPEVWTGTGAIANVQELYKNEKVSFMHGGQWHIPWARDNVKFNWGVTYLQKGKKLTTTPGGDVYAAFSQTKVPGEAATVVEFLTSEEAQKQWNTVVFRVPALKSLAAPGAMKWTSHTAEMDLFVDHLRHGSTHMLNEYYADGWAKSDSMLRARTAELASGTTPPERWAQEVNAEIDRFIAAGN